MSGAELLSIEGVSLSFGGVRSLDSVSLEARRGEILGVIGPNGAGKSSLLNVISGFYRPDGGRIVSNGAERTRMRPAEVARTGVARTFQNIALFKTQTVRDNVMCGRNFFMRRNALWQALRAGPALREERENEAVAARVMERLGLLQVASETAGQLPYGLQKRVELARALAAAPDLLLLDEPMAGMNRAEKLEMAGFIRTFGEQGDATTILVEHDMSVVMNLCHRIVVLDQGRVIATGAPAEIRSDPRVIDAYLGRSVEV